MKRLLIGASAAYSTAATPDKMTEGQVGFYSLVNGVPTIDGDGTVLKKMGSLILKKNGLLYDAPLYKDGFSYTKQSYIAGTKFEAEFTVPAISPYLEYALNIVKKGVSFNERSNWNIGNYIISTMDTAEKIAEDITKRINSLKGIDIKAELVGSTITLTSEGYEDFEVVMGDNMRGVEVTYTTRGVEPICDAFAIADLAKQCAADSGFNDTDSDNIYPGYPVNPLARPDSADTGFTLYTMTFTVPSLDRTIDTKIKQIVHLAVPTGSACIANLDTILAKYVE